MSANKIGLWLGTVPNRGVWGRSKERINTSENYLVPFATQKFVSSADRTGMATTPRVKLPSEKRLGQSMAMCFGAPLARPKLSKKKDAIT